MTNTTDYEAETRRLMAEEKSARLAKYFAKCCPEEFRIPISRELLKSPEAFDQVLAWDWSFPGLCCVGGTNSGKTRAVWKSIESFIAAEREEFRTYTAREFTEEYFRHHMEGEPGKFWRNLGWKGEGWSGEMMMPKLIFVDDLDKIDMNDRNCGLMFELYDKIYRDHVPAITTTNQSRAWWTGKMGEAFVRRLMDDAQRELKF